MKRLRIWLLIISVIVVCGGFCAWKFWGPATETPSGEFLYVKTGWTTADIKKELISKGFIKDEFWYNWAVRFLRFNNAKPGRYKVPKGTSLVKLVRMLRAGDQSKLAFVITKLRTRESLAGKIGAQFECDSASFIQYINNPDTLSHYGLDTNTVMCVAMPFTYSLNWNSSAGRIFKEMQTSYQRFWTAERKAKAAAHNLSPEQVSALASIVEEETRIKADKYNIASTYLNRIAKNMMLQADPTVKFALRDFALKRVTGVHLKVESPYNTYQHTGLPPGPICTPSVESIEAVLDAPQTEYLYFVASSAFDGTSVFTTNLTDHMKYARLYQHELTRRMDSAAKAKAKLIP